MPLEGLRNQERLKLKAARRFLFCIYEVNILNEKVNTILKSMDALDSPSEGLDVELNTEKTKHMLLLIYFQQDATLHSLFISGKLLYIFRVVFPPETRRAVFQK